MTVTGDPMVVVPPRIVKVSVPSLTVPAGLVMVTLRGTLWPPTLKVAECAGRWLRRNAGAALIDQGVTAIGVADEVGGAVVDGLDRVGTGRGSGWQDVGCCRGTRAHIHGDGTADDRGAVQESERLGAFVDCACGAGDGGAVEGDRLAGDVEGSRGRWPAAVDVVLALTIRE